MADRQLIWTCHMCDGDPTNLLPAYYMESEYVPVAVRIHAETAPSLQDAQFEIYDDGVTIIDDRTFRYEDYIANTQTYTGNFDIDIPVGATVDEMAENFNTTPIEAGSWITCAIRNDGAGRDFTVILELDKLSESDEDTE